MNNHIEKGELEERDIGEVNSDTFVHLIVPIPLTN